MTLPGPVLPSSTSLISSSPLCFSWRWRSRTSVKLSISVALLSQPGSYHVWSTLAEGYYVSGEYEKAFRASEQALRLGSEKKATQENLMAYKEQLRKCMRAKEAMSLIE